MGVYRYVRYICVLLCCLSVGCAGQRQPDELTASLAPPTWPVQSELAPVAANAHEIPANWLTTLQSPPLEAYVEDVLAANLLLRQQRAQVEILRERVVQVRADRLPALSLSVAGQRSHLQPNGVVTESYSAIARGSMELDLWGKLSDAQRVASLDYMAADLRLLQSERETVANAATATFDAITATRLQELFAQRLITLGNSLDIIQRGYRSGLNEALDVYLARTTLEQERARVANQTQANYVARTNMQLLAAQYPDAEIATTPALPPLNKIPGIGLPSDVLTRRPDIQAAWLDLLAADASLAIAHKNRFPSLTLSASGSDTDNALHNLLDGGQLGWSVAASLFQPLYQGGRLRSLERAAQVAVEQAEAAYLAVVYLAFAEVQNELNNAVQLDEQLAALLVAQGNALNALNLAYDQYHRGLVNYATVLESQRLAFDTQTAVVQSQNQQLASRVRLLLALGGDY